MSGATKAATGAALAMVAAVIGAAAMVGMYIEFLLIAIGGD